MSSEKMLILMALSAIITLFSGCGGVGKATVEKENFGRTMDGQMVELYTLTNRNGLQARITNYGGIVVSLKVPDRSGNLDDVVLGFDALVI